MTFTLPLSFFLKSPARYSLRPYSISCLLFKFLCNPFFSSGHLCFFVMIAKVDYFQARSLNLIKAVVPLFKKGLLRIFPQGRKEPYIWEEAQWDHPFPGPSGRRLSSSLL